jgi:glycyl-tRNA synthetase
MFLSILTESFHEEDLENDTKRLVLKIPVFLAPFKAAILPLIKKDGLDEKANELYENLRPFLNVTKDEKDAIGRRYRRQDAIGTPVCITIDHDSLKDNSVTFRLRDTMKQYRVDLNSVKDELFKITNPANFLHKK